MLVFPISNGMNRNAISVLKTSSLSILFLIIIAYALFQGSKIIIGPTIKIYSPTNGATFNQSLIEIEGVAKNISYINLDDRPIFTDKNGYFKEKFLLSPGYNIIKLDAMDKFKNKTEKILEVVLKEY